MSNDEVFNFLWFDIPCSIFCGFLFIGFEKKLEWGISRILYPFRGHDHFTGITVTRYLMQPTRRHQAGSLWDVFLFGLAPDGVYPALQVTMQAVSFYLTISPLPHPERCGGIFSVALSASHPAFVLRTILPCGVRTFLSGLRGPSDHAPTPKKLLFSLFRRSLMVHDALASRAVKKFISTEQQVVLLGWNGHETTLTYTIQNIDNA